MRQAQQEEDRMIDINMEARKKYRIITTMPSGKQEKISVTGFMVPTLVKAIAKQWSLISISVDGNERYHIDETRSINLENCINVLITSQDERLIF